MQEDFVEVYSKTTGAKQMVPAHFVDHPILGADFGLTDAGTTLLRRHADQSATPATNSPETGSAGPGADVTPDVDEDTITTDPANGDEE